MAIQQAMFNGRGKSSPLGNLVPSCVFDLDATLNDSYPGSGDLWINYEPTPADGSASSAYNFDVGASSGSSSSDPTFTGAAGSPSAYWSMDGGDCFSINGSLTAFLQNMHKSSGGADYWLSFAMRAQTSGTEQILFNSDSGASNRNGPRISIGGGDDQLRLINCGASGFSTPNTPSGSVISDNSDYVFIISYIHSTNTFRSWINDVRQSDITITPNTSTTNPTDTFLFRRPAGNDLFVASGTRIYAAGCGNAAIGNVEAGLIYPEYKFRHERAY